MSHKDSKLDSGEVSVWLQRLKSESNDQAIEMIWERYYQQLIRFARRKLGNVPKRAFDEDDIVSDALQNFFDGVKREQFPKLEDRNDLWKILLAITLRQVSQKIRVLKTQKRGGGRVRGDSVFFAPGNPENAGFDQIQHPGIFEETLSLEMKERLESLQDDDLQDIARLKLKGFTNVEISESSQVSERTIERKLERIRELWSQPGGSDSVKP